MQFCRIPVTWVRFPVPPITLPLRLVLVLRTRLDFAFTVTVTVAVTLVTVLLRLVHSSPFVYAFYTLRCRLCGWVLTYGYVATTLPRTHARVTRWVTVTHVRGLLTGYGYVLHTRLVCHMRSLGFTGSRFFTFTVLPVVVHAVTVYIYYHAVTVTVTVLPVYGYTHGSVTLDAVRFVYRSRLVAGWITVVTTTHVVVRLRYTFTHAVVVHLPRTHYTVGLVTVGLLHVVTAGYAFWLRGYCLRCRLRTRIAVWLPPHRRFHILPRLVLTVYVRFTGCWIHYTFVYGFGCVVLPPCVHVWLHRIAGCRTAHTLLRLRLDLRLRLPRCRVPFTPVAGCHFARYAARFTRVAGLRLFTIPFGYGYTSGFWIHTLHTVWFTTRSARSYRSVTFGYYTPRVHVPCRLGCCCRIAVGSLRCYTPYRLVVFTFDFGLHTRGLRCGYTHVCCTRALPFVHVLRLHVARCSLVTVGYHG